MVLSLCWETVGERTQNVRANAETPVLVTTSRSTPDIPFGVLIHQSQVIGLAPVASSLLDYNEYSGSRTTGVRWSGSLFTAATGTTEVTTRRAEDKKTKGGKFVISAVVESVGSGAGSLHSHSSRKKRRDLCTPLSVMSLSPGVGAH